MSFFDKCFSVTFLFLWNFVILKVAQIYKWNNCIMTEKIEQVWNTEKSKVNIRHLRYTYPTFRFLKFDVYIPCLISRRLILYEYFIDVLKLTSRHCFNHLMTSVGHILIPNMLHPEEMIDMFLLVNFVRIKMMNTWSFNYANILNKYI